jgi:hypothetical protein
MVPIPDELLEQAGRGNLLLFVGERLARDAAGQVAVDQWAAQLANRCGINDLRARTFPSVAQAYEDKAGRTALARLVREQIEVLGDKPQDIHHLIAGLTDCNLLVTTCIDQRLERAFAQAGRQLDVIVGNVDVSF